MDKAKKTFIINALRRCTYRWPGRWLAEKRSHLPLTKRYYCEDCGTVCRKKETQMDHIDPVIPVTGFDDWEKVLDRMFAHPDGWQRLCKPCHAEKTKGENQIRPQSRKKVNKKVTKKRKKS